MNTPNDRRQRRRPALRAVLITALLLSQQGFAFQALAGTVVETPKTVSGTNNTGAVGAGLGRTSALSGSQLAPANTVLNLSQPGLGAVPSVAPQVAGPQAAAPLSVIPVQTPVAPGSVLAAPSVFAPAALPAKAQTTSGRLSQISESLQPDLKSLSSGEFQADQAPGMGERVMAKALGQKTQELPASEASVAGAAEGRSPKLKAGLQKADPSWWKDPSRTHGSMTVPLYALRRAENDPGVGKFSDLGAYYRDVLAKQGVDVIHLLPHFAVLGESPYAPVSLYALNEDNLDWSQVAEVQGRPDLLKRLAAPGLADQQKVNYAALREREGKVAREAYQIFQKEHLARNTARAQDYQAFAARSSHWLGDYAEFMALSRLIGKPALDWTKEEQARARQNPDFSLMVETRKYAQWQASGQFRGAMDTIHAAGGKAIFDIPMFRAKNSVDAWKHPEYFTDIRTRNPGVVNQWVNENWGDLALWNWSKLKSEGYQPMLTPFAHWLDNGFDGARVDALHFAYPFGNGQLASGDETGDDYVGALAEVFKKRGALPVAEAFEGKADNALRFGFVTVYGDWKKLSTHDDPRSNGFMGKYLDLSQDGVSGRSSRFVGYTLGDEWGDPVPVKVVKDGSSYWSYRIPLPSDPDYASRARSDVRGQLGGLKAVWGGSVWKAAEAAWAAFAAAGDSFVKHFDGSVQIWAASMDWFLEEWGRDTFISSPGLLMSAGRFAEAKENMRNFAKYERDGLIPNKIPSDYNTVDGSLWFVQAVRKYADATHDAAFVAEMLPVLRRIMERYASGTGYQRYGRFNKIYMDQDGLIVSPGQATWMDADPEGRDKPVTPRNGKAVEINALWYANLRFLARLERQAGQASAAQALDARADLVKKSFNEKFWFATEDNKRAWGETGGALRDVVEGDAHGEAVRPNMLFAVSHGEDLLSPERQRAVVLAATKDLLTPYGLRTLSYRDSNYRAVYETWKAPLEKDQAYHQGTVWPWLMGTYVDALARVRRAQGWDEGRIREEVRGIMTPLVEFLVTHPEGSLPEVFDGGQAAEALLRFSFADPLGLGGVVSRLARSQNRGGTRSQAWSVGEAMRVLVEYGLTGAAPR